MISRNPNFKTIQISLFYVEELKNDTNMYRFLLPKIMSCKTSLYQTKKQISEHLENLYGASFHVQTNLINELSTISFSLTIPDPKILGEPDLLNQALSFIHEVINNSIIEEKYLNEELTNLTQMLQTRFENKNILANEKFLEDFISNKELLKLNGGSLEDIKNFDKNFLIKAHTNLKNNAFYYIANGNLTDEEEELIASKLPQKTYQLKFNYPKKHYFNEEKNIILLDDGKQSVIKVGYSIPFEKTLKTSKTMILANILLGGFPNSRLFIEIREKLNLSYSVYSSYSPINQSIVVTAGVNNDKTTFALKSIQDLMKDVAKNGFTSDEFDIGKNFYLSKILEIFDNQSSITTSLSNQIVFDEHLSLEDQIALIETITFSDINNIMKNIVFKASFILEGGNEVEKK